MGYITKIQVIQRAEGSRQFYIICPAALGEALEMQKGEEVEWVVEDKQNLLLRRLAVNDKKRRKRAHAA